VWAIDNKTAYAVERNWVRDKHGEHHWVVAIKASFDIEPKGLLKLADEQAPPVLAPEYFGEPGKSALRFDTDVGLKKPATDVLVNAHAHAPQGKEAEVIQVSLVLGGMRKALLVHGDRVHQTLGGVHSITRAAPFLTRAIRYEMAYGGTDLSDPDPRRHTFDERNPVGRGAQPPAALKNQAAYAIEYPSGDPAKRGPAGFGAIDAWWAPRAQYAGTYDESWVKSQKPFLPLDFDERFTLCSPADQRPKGYLTGGEPVELLNMSVEGRMQFTLPKLRFRLETRFGARKEEHAADLVSVIIEPEPRKLVLVWQSTLSVKARDCDYLDQTLVIEEGAS
jgi:hypothetical protein